MASVMNDQPQQPSTTLGARKSSMPSLQSWKDFGPLSRFIAFLGFCNMLIPLVVGLPLQFLLGTADIGGNLAYLMSAGLVMMISVPVGVLEKRVADLEDLVQSMNSPSLDEIK